MVLSRSFNKTNRYNFFKNNMDCFIQWKHTIKLDVIHDFNYIYEIISSTFDIDLLEYGNLKCPEYIIKILK